MSQDKLNNLISSLKVVDLDRDRPTYFEDFENIVIEIGSLQNPDSISLLAQFLDDDPEELNLMWGIIHTIEIFEKSAYVREILKVSPQLGCNSPEWAETIFMRILNSDDYKIELIRQLKKTSLPIKKSVKDILERIQAESPEFSAKIHPVLAVLN